MTTVTLAPGPLLDSPKWDDVMRVPGDKPEAHVPHLIEGNVYEFRVVAVNRAGPGVPSDSTAPHTARAKNRESYARTLHAVTHGRRKRGGGGRGIRSPVEKSVGDIPPEIRIFHFLTSIKSCILQHFPNKVAEIRRETIFLGGRWVWVPMNSCPPPQSKLSGNALGVTEISHSQALFNADHIKLGALE